MSDPSQSLLAEKHKKMLTYILGLSNKLGLAVPRWEQGIAQFGVLYPISGLWGSREKNGFQKENVPQQARTQNKSDVPLPAGPTDPATLRLLMKFLHFFIDEN